MSTLAYLDYEPAPIHAADPTEPVIAPSGQRFPQLYRLRGFSWEAEHAGPAARQHPSPVLYTLDRTATAGYSRTRIEPIRGFDRSVDSGWLYVRHHATEQSAEGYCDAMTDRCPENIDAESHVDAALFKTALGIFTLLHTQPPPGAPDHLVIYVAKRIAADRAALGAKRRWVEEHLIVLPDGSTTSDSNILFPNDA
ncbi:MAG TPA: hypothetical protein VFL98_02025 [Candidatus Paceibacterota bacterium]|nr:hypothetical protein [Candidatus Paceibacterota bacterium]